MSECKECCHKTKERSEKEYKDMINRLSRIEGRSGGLKAWSKEAPTVRRFLFRWQRPMRH